MIQVWLHPPLFIEHSSISAKKEKQAILQDKFNQSINQSNFYCVNIPGEARLSGETAESVFNSKIKETVP